MQTDNKLKEEKEYAEAEGKRLSDTATHWKINHDLLKEEKAILLHALKNLLSSYRADFRNITGGELNKTEAVIEAENAINLTSKN